jgi:hypothetical protein
MIVQDQPCRYRRFILAPAFALSRRRQRNLLANSHHALCPSSEGYHRCDIFALDASERYFLMPVQDAAGDGGVQRAFKERKKEGDGNDVWCIQRAWGNKRMTLNADAENASYVCCQKKYFSDSSLGNTYKVKTEVCGESGPDERGMVRLQLFM